MKQLDEMTDGLRRRLLSGREADQQAADSESAVPLSTSSALMTAGSTLPEGTWELPSASHGTEHAAPDVMASSGGSATTGDVVTDLMRRTLEHTGGCNSYREDVSDTLPKKRNHTLGDNEDADVRNLVRDGTANHTGENLSHGDDKAEQWNSNTGASCDIVRYTDSLKNAQMLLEQLKEMTAHGSQPLAAASSHRVDSPVDVDFDEDGMQEDDTFANIWALRQAIGHDEADVESLDSTIPPDEPNKSYISPRTLNNVESDHDDSSAVVYAAKHLGGCGDIGDVAESALGKKQPMSVNHSGESGDTWFIDTHDARDIDNMVALEVHCRLSENGDDRSPSTDKAAEVMPDATTGMHSPGRPLSRSSPSSLAQFLPASSPALSTARKSRSLRRTAVRQHEQMYGERYIGSGSDSNSESGDFMATSRLRHHRPQTSKHAPCDQPTASIGDDQLPVDDASSVMEMDNQIEDMATRNEEILMTEEIPVTEGQDIESNDSEPQTARNDDVPVQLVNQDSLLVNNGVSVANEQALNGHHFASDENLYPSEYHLIIVMYNTFTHFCSFCTVIRGGVVAQR